MHQDLHISFAEDTPCPNCRGFQRRVDRREAELVCACGLVLEERLVDEAPEYRSFSDAFGVRDDNSRVGKATNLDAPGDRKDVAPGVAQITREFKDYTRDLGIGRDCLETAEYMFQDYVKAHPTIGLNRHAAYVACVYYANKAAPNMRSMTEIAMHFDAVLSDNPRKPGREIKRRIARIVNQVASMLRADPKWRSIILDRVITGRDVIGRMVGMCGAVIPGSLSAVELQCKHIWDALQAAKSPLLRENGQGVNIAVIVRACELQGIQVTLAGANGDVVTRAISGADIMEQVKGKYDVLAGHYKRFYEAVAGLDVKRTQHYTQHHLPVPNPAKRACK